MSKYIIGIDQSTQGTKALLVDEGGHLIHRADRSHRQIVNEAGWVSHDPAEDRRQRAGCGTHRGGGDRGRSGRHRRRSAFPTSARPPLPGAGTTGEPLCDAVVWQCARARELCDELAAREGVAELVRDTTGLVLSPDYPAGKMAWNPRERSRGCRGRGGGRAVPGHHRCLGGLDAHGRRGVPLRLVQCQPHAAF